MSQNAIVVENLSKHYLIGHQSAATQYKYAAFRDVIAQEARNFARKAIDIVHGRRVVQGDEIEEFWALKNVSFEVKQGEVLGIIGRNGAGKSTLLKILSRITEPTQGRVTLRGRVSSLLEVGTGFHPELTGRENIFLNGAILGMNGQEIREKFDEIVAFAEVEKFLDTPVKQYSSGMYVRLAFAVAAHLEPEILIVDEVLAVGDIDFQRKCLGKMQDVATKDGRTILMVSHNMAAVESMCKSAVLLSDGRCLAQGSTSTIVREYLRGVSILGSTTLDNRTDREGSGDIRFVSMSLEGPGRAEAVAFRCGQESVFHFVFENRTDRELNAFRADFIIENEMGQRMASLDTMLLGSEFSGISPGRHSLRVVIPKMSLMPGRYRLRIFSTVNAVIADWIRHAATFDVEAGDYYGSGQLPPPNEGMFLLEHQFVMGEVRPSEADELAARGAEARYVAGGG